MGRGSAGKRFDVLLYISKNGGIAVISDQKSVKHMEILLVEDNPADVALTKRALKSGKVPYNVHVANDGADALAFLHDVENEQAPRPDLVLLDLNMPRVSGQEVLEKIKSNEKLASIPVVVLTTSRDEEDIAKTYKLHANSFITKPVDWQEFINVARLIEEYWFSVVKLP
jgi:two-component system, chemotaxis family, response regulator Rcp1